MKRFPLHAPLVAALNVSFTKEIFESILNGKINVQRQKFAPSFHAANIASNSTYRELVASLEDDSAEDFVDSEYFFFECYLKLQWLKSNGAQSPGASYKIIKYEAEPAIPTKIGAIVKLRSKTATAYIDRIKFQESDEFFIGQQRLYILCKGKLVLFWKRLDFKGRPFFKDGNTLNCRHENLIPPPAHCRVKENNSIMAKTMYFHLNEYDNDYKRMFRIIERFLEHQELEPKRRPYRPEPEEPTDLQPLLDEDMEHYREAAVGYAMIRQDDRVFKQLYVKDEGRVKLLSQCVINYDHLHSHVLYLDGKSHNLRRANLVVAPLNVFWDAEKHVIYYYTFLRTLPRRVPLETLCGLPKTIALAKAKLEKAEGCARLRLPQGVIPDIQSGMPTRVTTTESGFGYRHKDTGELTTTDSILVAQRDKLYGNRFIRYKDFVEIILAQSERIEAIVIDSDKLGTNVLHHRWREVLDDVFENEEGEDMVTFLFGKNHDAFYFVDGNKRNLTRRNLCPKFPNIFWEVERQRVLLRLEGKRVSLIPDLVNNDLETLVQKYITQYNMKVNI
jgi:hypothetical protein